LEIPSEKAFQSGFVLPGIDVFDTVVDGIAPKFEIRQIALVPKRIKFRRSGKFVFTSQEKSGKSKVIDSKWSRVHTGTPIIHQFSFMEVIV
jgi:chorismate synthase